MPRAIVVGVVGDSGAGKTTITRGLTRVIGDAHVAHVSADDYHRYDRRQRRVLGATPAGVQPPHGRVRAAGVPAVLQVPARRGLLNFNTETLQAFMTFCSSPAARHALSA
jgi:ABC-type dipeptide/oligopeptide/nickel transport system ATPase component